MNAKGVFIGVLSVIGAETAYILPQLTGKTAITKMQLAAMVIGGLGVAASTIKALLTDPNP